MMVPPAVDTRRFPGISAARPERILSLELASDDRASLKLPIGAGGDRWGWRWWTGLPAASPILAIQPGPQRGSELPPIWE